MRSSYLFVFAFLLVSSFVSICAAQEITEEQAVSIAGSTQDVKDLMNFSMDVKTLVFKTGGCDMIKQVSCEIVKCTQEIDKPAWVVVYHREDAWQSAKAIALKFGIDARTGEIRSQYPGSEYIKNKGFCKTDQDCVLHYTLCGCVNYISAGFEPSSIVYEMCNPSGLGLGLNCTCINNTCSQEREKE